MRGQPLPEAELEQLYYGSKLSMQQIAHHFGCSINKVVYWMQHYGFARRNWSDATYVYRNPEGDPFVVRMPETAEEWKLFGVGIGLYMGEGTKTGFIVSFANSNPGIHRTFMLFLERFCGIQKRQYKAWLNIFDDCDIDGATQWWAEQLDLNIEQFYKTQVRKSKQGSYTKKSVYGTLTISIANTRLHKIINDWCEQSCQ